MPAEVAFETGGTFVGYDIYPIYGYNKPEWLCLSHEATDQLVRLAGKCPRAVNQRQ